MKTHAINSSISYNSYYSNENKLNSIKRTISEQGLSLIKLSEHLDCEQYNIAIDLLSNCHGHVIVSGMGKSGHIGKKIAATFASTGTPSFFIHPAEAFHGDLGMITADDVVILISNSGETDEILQLIPSLKNFNNPIIAITGKIESTLAKNANATLEILMTRESCPNNLAPTTSTTITLAIGDALAIELMHRKKFQPNDFARFHPGGSLGRRLLTRLQDVMSTDLTIVEPETPFKELVALMCAGKHGIAVVVENSLLKGVVTDGDLRRSMAKNDFNMNILKTKDIMTTSPITLPQTCMLSEAEETMKTNHIKQILVINETNHPVGIIEFFN